MGTRNFKNFAPALLAAVLSTFNLSAAAVRNPSSVAIVIDAGTYSSVKGAVDSYCSAIQKYEGKNTHVVSVGPAATPEFVRDTLKALYSSQKLEGAVLVGNIPIPMIRRAHHLATAFKMNPKAAWKASSIPSDRFYDDFDLAFDFLKQDETDKALYYYDLSPKGAQRVDCEIYTARIKPAGTDKEHSFAELIEEFLLRAASAKENRERLDNAFHFGGHGNSSESFNARVDESRAMYEQFDFKSPDRQIHFINFDEDSYVKSRIREIFADPGIDYAHFHMHGARHAQYLSKEPYTFMASGHLEYARRFFRGKMRDASDTAATRAALIKDYGIPSSWLDGWNKPDVNAADSLTATMTDILLPDMDGFKSGIKVLILDACFNGAFIHDDYIASRYAFGHGSSTMAVFANSVNIIQDHWKNEHAGLLGYGVCVGNWAKLGMTLESHLFGDPTYSFERKEDPNLKNIGNLDRIVSEKDFRLKSSAAKSALPADIYGYFLRMRYEKGLSNDNEMLTLLKNHPQMNVRMEALANIVRGHHSGKSLSEAISAGLDDSYEMIRRMSARYASNSGDPALLRKCVVHYLDPLETSRVRYHLASAIALYPADKVIAVMDSIVASRAGIWPEKRDYATLVRRVAAAWESSSQDFRAIADESASLKDRRFTIKGQRNRCSPSAIEPMLRVIGNEQADESLRADAAEALGWYVYSFRREEILEKCKALSLTVKAPSVKDELERTIARLK